MNGRWSGGCPVKSMGELEKKRTESINPVEFLENPNPNRRRVNRTWNSFYMPALNGNGIEVWCPSLLSSFIGL